MMKKYLILTLIFLSFFTTNAQKHIKYWADGKLTWDDFQGKYTTRQITNLSYSIVYQTDKKKIDNVIYRGLFSEAYINKSLSFVHPNLQNSNYLAYNQVVFNLIELSKRKLQKKLFNLGGIFEANAFLVNAQSELQKRIRYFQELSSDGLQNEITKQWLASTKKELLSTNNFLIPNYKKSKWTYGMYLGLDYGIYGDTYKEIFNNTLSLAMGFEFSYRKIFMLLNMSLTNSRLNKDLQNGTFLIPKGDKSTITLGNISLGYPVYETDKLKILPFAGYGITAFGETSSKKNRDEISKGTSFFGFNIDFKNRKRVDFRPSIFGFREETNSYIRARFFISNSNFSPVLKGYGIHIGIAYGFEGRLLSVKK